MASSSVGASMLAGALMLAVLGCEGASVRAPGESPGSRPSLSQASSEIASPQGGSGPGQTERGGQALVASGGSLAGSTAPATHFPATDRVVAFGDVHGDLQATLAALRLAGAIGDGDDWTGGSMTLVQTGDQLDRGDDEPEILALFEKLRTQASAAGGAFHVLNGNHELMNSMGDLRYVTRGGFADYASAAGGSTHSADAGQVPEAMRGRLVAFAPGSTQANKLAERNIVVVVGDTVFVHGGVTPSWARYGIEKINAESRTFLRGGRDDPPRPLVADDGPLWSRHFSDDPDAEDCALLVESLRILSASRMVVGHTVDTAGIRSSCDGKVWAIDVGMAAHYGGRPSVLEISGSEVRAISQE